jgi:hypothetical protein
LLNDLAVAGKEAAPGAIKYLPAQNKTEMVAALNAITDRLTSCLYTLDRSPPAPNFVAMDVEGIGRIPRDQSHLEGWDYGPNGKADVKTLRIFGKACDKLISTPAPVVQMTFGCQNVPPP